MTDGPHVRYYANNSGGRHWMTDTEWESLEAAGWEVQWVTEKTRWATQGDDGQFRWLGARAGSAILRGTSSITEAIESFEANTQQCASDEGCNCCGRPHSFEAYDENGREIFDDEW